MNSILKLVLLLALAGVLYVGVNLIYKNAPRLPEQPIDLGQSTAQNDTVAIHEDEPTYKVDVTYRHFGVPALDSKVDARVQELVDGFKKQVAEYPPVADSVVHQYTLSGEAAALYLGSDFASMRINFYEYTGGAHGLPLVMTLNYDRKTGEEIPLERALSLTGLSLDEVAQKSLAQLHQEFGETVFDDGAAAKAENYGTFLVGPYNVIFVFQAYQVVAYAAGMPEVSFSRTQ